MSTTTTLAALTGSEAGDRERFASLVAKGAVWPPMQHRKSFDEATRCPLDSELSGIFRRELKRYHELMELMSVRGKVTTLLATAKHVGISAFRLFSYFDVTGACYLTDADFRRGLETIDAARFKLNDAEVVTVVNIFDSGREGRVGRRAFEQYYDSIDETSWRAEELRRAASEKASDDTTTVSSLSLSTTTTSSLKVALSSTPPCSPPPSPPPLMSPPSPPRPRRSAKVMPEFSPATSPVTSPRQAFPQRGFHRAQIRRWDPAAARGILKSSGHKLFDAVAPTSPRDHCFVDFGAPTSPISPGSPFLFATSPRRHAKKVHVQPKSAIARAVDEIAKKLGDFTLGAAGKHSPGPSAVGPEELTAISIV